ncbi:hypothetical protein OTU49_017361, partial [Cherax quadricarinatus]
ITLVPPQDVGLPGCRGVPEAPRGRISDYNALMLLRLCKPRLLVAGAREVVNCMLGDPTLLRPDLALSKMLGVEDRKLPVLVWTQHQRDVGGEVVSAARVSGLAGITRVVVAPIQCKVSGGGAGEAGVPPLATVLANAVQQGGWVLVQGAESPAVLPTLLAAMTSLGSPDVKVHDDFRLIVTVGVGKEEPSDLILLARPLYAHPAHTLPATLTALAALINGHHYRHHYLGSSWRRAVWQVATAHTIIIVTRYWHSHPPPAATPHPPTLTPRTQVASTRPPSSPTPTRATGEPGKETTGYQGLDGHLSLEEVTVTWSCLTKLSLERSLDDETLVQFLGVMYGRREAWQEAVCTLPREVGLVSKEAALSIVSAHLTACLQDLHNLTL